MATAAFGGRPFSMGRSGTLDQGRIFSLVQFILERETGEGMWRLGPGIDVGEAALAVTAIQQIGSSPDLTREVAEDPQQAFSSVGRRE